LSGGRRRLRALLVRVDFLFERGLRFVGSLLELGNASSRRPAQFGRQGAETTSTITK
jgi:hypothetical protein